MALYQDPHDLAPNERILMQRMRTIMLRPEALAHHIDAGRILAVMVGIGLALVIAVVLVFGVAVRAGMAADFEQRITLDVQHSLVIHNGPSPTCASISNPPQHDCFRPGPERRAFSVAYLAPDGVWSLVWFQPPEP